MNLNFGIRGLNLLGKRISWAAFRRQNPDHHHADSRLSYTATCGLTSGYRTLRQPGYGFDC